MPTNLTRSGGNAPALPVDPSKRVGAIALGRRIAQTLADLALDPASGLSPAERVALAEIVVAVDVEACRRLGIEPPSDALRDELRAALADPGAPRAPP